MPEGNPTDPYDISYYSAAVNAWFNTRLEHDKSLLTLSTGGIGLLFTILTTIGVRSADRLILYVIALLSFVSCVISILIVYRQNADYIEQVIQKQNPSPSLKHLDVIAMVSFIIGVIFSTIIGVLSAASTL